MDRFSTPAKYRTGLALIEIFIVILVIGLAISLLLPKMQNDIASARRLQCGDRLQQLALALHNYAQANRSAFPAGAICNSQPHEPGNQYDVWAEAGKSGPENQGTSLLLAVLPFVDKENVYNTWASGKPDSQTSTGHWSPADNVGNKLHPGPANLNIQAFSCPSRRKILRPNYLLMLSHDWTGGGADYGGCAGRHAAFTLNTGYNLCDASMHYEPEFRPLHPTNRQKTEDTEDSRWGIFGRVNICTQIHEITDGTSHTIMIGELQRITDLTPSSKDGWSVGGPATLFTTGALVARNGKTLTFTDAPGQAALSNNGFFGSPGSEHVNGANYGFADASVRFLTTTMDPSVFALMGSMADNADLCQTKEE